MPVLNFLDYPMLQFHHATIKKDSLVENGGDFDQKKLLLFLEAQGHSDLEIKSITASVEDCFMELAG